MAKFIIQIKTARNQFVNPVVQAQSADSDSDNESERSESNEVDWQ